MRPPFFSQDDDHEALPILRFESLGIAVVLARLRALALLRARAAHQLLLATTTTSSPPTPCDELPPSVDDIKDDIQEAIAAAMASLVDADEMSDNTSTLNQY